MAHPTTYATHNEIMVANQFCSIQFRLTFAGHPYPLPPGANTCDVLHSNYIPPNGLAILGQPVNSLIPSQAFAFTIFWFTRLLCTTLPILG